MTAEPRFVEPIYLCEIQAPDSVIGNVYTLISQRRGVVISEEHIMGTPLVIIKAHLPVSESFGFNAILREVTSGKAFPQCVLDHWQIIQSDPLDPSSSAG